MHLLFAFVLMCGVAIGGEIEVRKGDKTAVDEYFEYTYDGTSRTYDGIRIHGRLTNISPKIFDMVSVVLTIKDELGNFIARDYAPIHPMKILPGGVSFHELDVEIDKEAKPFVIEWSVNRATEEK